MVNDTAVLVGVRNEVQARPDLGMSSDPYEVPVPQGDGQPEGYWIGTGRFDGAATAADGSPGDGIVHLAGRFALALTGGRLYGILSPAEPSQPAVWVSARIGALQVVAETQGRRKKASTHVKLLGWGWEVGLSDVGRLDRPTGEVEPGATEALLARLQEGGPAGPSAPAPPPPSVEPTLLPAAPTAPAPTVPPPAAVEPSVPPVVPDPTVVVPPPPVPSAVLAPPPVPVPVVPATGSSWRLEPGLGGLYRLYDATGPTPVTSLVDRSAPLADQAAALHPQRFPWAPVTFLDRAHAELDEDVEPDPQAVGIGIGRVLLPITWPFTVVVHASMPRDNPLAWYLFAQLHDRHLVLDDGERILWSGRGATLVVQDDQIPPKSAPIRPMKHLRSRSSLTVTDRRIVLWAEVEPDMVRNVISPRVAKALGPAAYGHRHRSHVSWATQLRLEWLQAIVVRESGGGGGGSTKEVAVVLERPPKERWRFYLVDAEGRKGVDADQVVSALVAAVSGVPGVAIARQWESTSRARRDGFEAEHRLAVDGSVPVSLPESF